MLRILYYLCKKSGKISTKKGGGLIIRHGRIIRILRYYTCMIIIEGVIMLVIPAGIIPGLSVSSRYPGISVSIPGLSEFQRLLPVSRN